MHNNESPRNDGLPKSSMKNSTCLKEPLLNSLFTTFFNQELSSSQKQVLTKLFFLQILSESKRFVSDILPVCNVLNVDGLLITVYIKKTFGSLSNSLLILLIYSSYH